MTADPRVWILAETFVDRELAHVEGLDADADPVRSLGPVKGAELLARRHALIERLADAMTLAIEQECDAIRQELQA